MIRKNLFSLIFIFIGLITGNGQIDYTFENQSLADWTQNQPNHWEISSINAIEGNYTLHHAFDTTASSHDQISLPLGFDMTKGKTLWQFKIRHGYSPSSSNNWAVILAADKNATAMTPDSNFSGYAIGVNFNNFTDDTLKLFRIDNGTITPILNTGINWQAEIGTSAYASIMVIRSSSGQWTVFVRKNMQSYDSLLFCGQTNDPNYTNAEYFGIYYEYTASQDQKLWFDDLHIITNYKQNNSLLTINQLTDTLFSTSVNLPGQQIITLGFEAPSGNSSNTTVKKIILLPSANNQISNWQNLFAKAVFNINSTNYYGIINENSLIFNTNIDLAPGDNLQGTLYLQVKTNPTNIQDNQILGILVSSDFLISDTESNSFADQIINTNFVYSVKASQLNFDQTPLSVRPNNPFYIKITATDQYGNLDQDANYTVTLSRDLGSGNITSTSSLTKTMSGGIVEWNDLTYNVKDTFRIRAYTPDLGYFYSPLIICSNYIFYLNDDFEDGDITDWQQNYPGHWQASTENPIMGQYSLYHIFDNSVSATEWITHRLNSVNLNDTTVVWDFYLRYENASPSSSNNWNILLMADENPVSNDIFNGYGVGINWNSTDDLLALWKITAGTPQQIITSTVNWQNDIEANQNVHIQIKRQPDATWELLIDTIGNQSFVSLGTTTDNTFTTANYFAIRYEYTSSQDRKLYLDNIYFGEPVPDTLPPVIDTAIAISADTVIIQFNEDIITNTLSTSNFSISEIGQPESISIQDSRHIKLTLSDTLKENQIYNLTATDITDLNGNTAQNLSNSLKWIAFHITSIKTPDSLTIVLNLNRNVDSATVQISNFSITSYTGQITSATITGNKIFLSLNQPMQLYNQYSLQANIKDKYGNPLKDNPKIFYFYIPQMFDVIINELMTDINPAPPALPQYKYIELYNRSVIPINMSGWTITIGDRNFDIPDNTVIPGLGYALICSPESEKYFQNLAKTIPILNEYYLTSSNTITLKDYQGKIIESLTYSNLWYNDPDKDDGGWALERIDPNNICSQENNWTASENPIGGTPGFVNSVIAENQDTIPPKLLSAQALSSTELQLNFNEIISQQSANAQINFVLNNQATPLYIEYADNNAKALILRFLVNFQDGINRLQIKNLTDNCGNQMPDTIVEFNYHKIHIIDVQPISDYQLKVYFSEAVEKNSSEQINNYFINQIGMPEVALRDNYNPSIVHLVFGQEFKQDSIYHISISHIFDLNNNECDSTVKSFVFHLAKPYDVVFNEFMLDVNPQPANLKPMKYIELVNIRPFDLWLENWTLTIDDENEVVLPAVKIPAQSYLILKTAPDSLCDCQSLNVLTTSQLKVEANYKLYSSQGQIIDVINLTKSFWQDEDKAEGGWSVERKNPLYHCENTYNWTATTSPNGGTPGQRNSVYSNERPNVPIKISYFKVENAKTINISFNYPIINYTATDTNSYKINNQKPLSVLQSDYQTFTLNLNSELKAGNNSVNISLIDDCGNEINFDTNFIYEFIHVQKVHCVDSNMLWVKLSEEAGPNFAQKQNYIVNGSINPQYIIKDAQEPNILYLYFEQSFKQGQNTISISGIKDVFGNQIPDYEQNFFYYAPKPQDILISEILPNPLSGCAKYIELYNNTDYPIYLHHLALANFNDSILENIEPITQDFILFQPHSYIAITTDTQNVKETYPVHGQRFLQIKTLPSMNSAQGNIAVLYKDSVLDYLQYSEEMHSPLIANPDGVALERISFQLPTNNADNWTSASSTVGYGTPATKNSQAANIDSLLGISAQMNLSSETISPDNDGYQDYLLLTILVDQPNIFGQIEIINRQGIRVRTLVNQQKLATQNVFRWDGTDDNGQKLPSGIYAVVAKLYTTEGKVRIIRKALAIAQKK